MYKVARLTSALVSASIATAGAASSPATDPCRKVTTEAVQLPSTAAVVRLAKDWADKINSPDDAAYVSFVKERGPVLLEGPERWLELRDILRGIRFCGVKAAQADTVELWAFVPNLDSYNVVRFKPGATEAEKVEFRGGSETDAVPPGGVGPEKLALPALLLAIEARAARAATEGRFWGTILVAQRGRVLFQKAYGFADRARHEPNRLDTQFRFGSIGKMFTAVAIMQLVEKGKIDLEAPVGRYLTDYPNRDIATKVTVADLLSHTGGTGDIFGPDFDTHRASLRDLRDYVDLYGKRPPDFAAGSRYAYSNYGFILLGRIVEQVSGLRYDEYVQRNIFTPSAMTSTGNRPEREVLPRRAVAYTGSGARLKSADETLPLNGTAAGGGYATAVDFKRFVGGLTSHRLLRRETLQKLITGGVRKDDGELAGFDFGGTTAGGTRFIGHRGDAPGVSASLQHFVKSGVTVIVLANRDYPAAESIAAFAAHRMPAD